MSGLRKAHERSIFKDMAINAANVQRIFVTMLAFDKGYAKVIEKDGQVVGGLVGVISDNQLGISCSQDLFFFSTGGSDLLIKDFLGWSKGSGAKFVQISDFSNAKRYHKLLKTVGLSPAGTNFIGVM